MENVSAFVSCSFDDADVGVVNAVTKVMPHCEIRAIDMRVPRADSITKRIKREIQDAHVFVAIATAEIVDPSRTRPWIVHEITWADSESKPIAIIRERSVAPGALAGHGALAHAEFDRADLANAIPDILGLLTSVRDEVEPDPVFVSVARRARPLRALRLRDFAAPHMRDATFRQGIDRLHRQIFKEPSNHTVFDAFIGINHSGLMIATDLLGRKEGKEARARLGFVMTSALLEPDADRVIVDSHLPDCRDSATPRLLVVDGQLKSGWSGQQVIQRVEEHYRALGQEPIVTYAVLVACGVRAPRDSRDPVPIGQLLSQATATLEHPPDHVAFVASEAIKAPHGIP